MLSDLFQHNEPEKATLHSKLFSVLPLAFEARLFADDDSPTSFEDLEHIIAVAQDHSAPKAVFKAFADYILSSHNSRQTQQNNSPVAPYLEPQVAARLICKLIVAIRNLPEYDTVEASRWIRCVVENILRAIKLLSQQPEGSESRSSLESNVSMLRAILGQALVLARSSYASITTSISNSVDQSKSFYPVVEVEFLATMLFNLAIDFFVKDMDDLAKEWGGKAVEVAELLQIESIDKRELGQILKTKMEMLGWK